MSEGEPDGEDGRCADGDQRRLRVQPPEMVGDGAGEEAAAAGTSAGGKSAAAGIMGL